MFIFSTSLLLLYVTNQFLNLSMIYKMKISARHCHLVVKTERSAILMNHLIANLEFPVRMNSTIFRSEQVNYLVDAAAVVL